MVKIDEDEPEGICHVSRRLEATCVWCEKPIDGQVHVLEVDFSFVCGRCCPCRGDAGRRAEPIAAPKRRTIYPIERPKLAPPKEWVNLHCGTCGYYARAGIEQMKAARLVCPVDKRHGLLLTPEERGEKRRGRYRPASGLGQSKTAVG